MLACVEMEPGERTACMHVLIQSMLLKDKMLNT